MLIDDRDYYRHRAEAEREQAGRAAHPKAAAAHHHLAEAYRERAAAPKGGG